jgi:hypothetical protein
VVVYVFATLVAHGGSAVFERRVITVELNVEQVQKPLVDLQHVHPQKFYNPFLHQALKRAHTPVRSEE